MKKIQENTYKENEIDLRTIIITLSNSKTLVLFFTLFFLLISSIYALSNKTQYESSAIIEIGQLNNDYIDIRYDLFNVRNPKVKITDYDKTLRLLSTTDVSKKESEKVLKAGVDSALIMINKFINNEIEGAIQGAMKKKIAEAKAKEAEDKAREAEDKAREADELESIIRNIENLKVKDSIISKELVRLSNLDKSLHGSSGIEGRISNLNIERDYLVLSIKEEIFKKDTIEFNMKKILDPENMTNSLAQEFSNESQPHKLSILIKDIESTEIQPDRTKIIIFGVLSGLFLSLIIILIRASLLNSSLNKEL
jgi:capsular polysaccharide biosynthesis protein